MRHTLRCYHETFKNLASGLRVLDYGSGPVLLSASTKASEIVLSDYVEKNCEVLRQWLERDPASFDWLPSFKFKIWKEKVKKKRRKGKILFANW